MSKRERRAFGSVRRLSSGRWQVRYRDLSGVMHTGPHTFTSKADAARYLATVEADVDLVALRGVMPEKTRETARIVIAKVVAEVLVRLEARTADAIRGALGRIDIQGEWSGSSRRHSRAGGNPDTLRSLYNP